VIREAAFQMPSQSWLRRSALFDTCPSDRAPAGFTWKKKPLRRSKNGSRTIVMRSSTSRSASRVNCVEMMSLGDRSRHRTPKYKALSVYNTRTSVSSDGSLPSTGSR
jgi:hypothetical protein